jgi:hypothetical protein
MDHPVEWRETRYGKGSIDLTTMLLIEAGEAEVRVPGRSHYNVLESRVGAGLT